jgi:hypothetical protein
MMAVDVLKSRGVPENRIVFLNLIASPEGIANFAKKFPKLRVVTAFVDQVSRTCCCGRTLRLIILSGARREEVSCMRKHEVADH